MNIHKFERKLSDDELTRRDFIVSRVVACITAVIVLSIMIGGLL